MGLLHLKNKRQDYPTTSCLRTNYLNAWSLPYLERTLSFIFTSLFSRKNEPNARMASTLSGTNTILLFLLMFTTFAPLIRTHLTLLLKKRTKCYFNAWSLPYLEPTLSSCSYSCSPLLLLSFTSLSSLLKKQSNSIPPLPPHQVSKNVVRNLNSKKIMLHYYFDFISIFALVVIINLFKEGCKRAYPRAPK